MQKTIKKIGKYLLLLLYVLLLLTGMRLALAENRLANYMLFFLILSLGRMSIYRENTTGAFHPAAAE